MKKQPLKVVMINLLGKTNPPPQSLTRQKNENLKTTKTRR